MILIVTVPTAVDCETPKDTAMPKMTLLFTAWMSKPPVMFRMLVWVDPVIFAVVVSSMMFTPIAAPKPFEPPRLTAPPIATMRALFPEITEVLPATTKLAASTYALLIRSIILIETEPLTLLPFARAEPEPPALNEKSQPSVFALTSSSPPTVTGAFLI